MTIGDSELYSPARRTAGPTRDGEELRLTVTPAGATSRLDGAWWPRSRDFERELPPLVRDLDQRWGRVTHATVNRRLWPSIPPHVTVGSHSVRLGWFDAEEDPHVIYLFSYGPGHRELLVVPPETDPRHAAAMMATASLPGDLHTASALVDPTSTDRWGSARWNHIGPRDWNAEQRTVHGA
ncbi:DUF5994 family protein [Streptomyces griseoviridis]|uniref:DUF5994 family protein n=1 Tax=Streptomyces griseoviridis TaxID=45398 RepID=UPI0033EB9931